MVRLLLCLIMWMLGAHEGAAEIGDSRRCQLAISRVEQQKGIPRHLLQAVSLGESGRMHEDGKMRAWPWTVQAEGQGRYLSSKQEAIAVVRELWEAGVRSIDVGCMQINLLHHPEAFETLEDAFDPEKNVGYAATFLLQLKKQQVTWQQAVAHYHSATEALHRPYRERIYKLWHAVQREGLDAEVLQTAPPSSWATTFERRWALNRSPFQRIQTTPFKPLRGEGFFSVKKSSTPQPKVMQATQTLSGSQQAVNRGAPTAYGQLQFFPLKRQEFSRLR